MPTVTQAQLTANGFTLVDPVATRFQRWTGEVNGQSVEVLWDSSTNKAHKVPDIDNAELLRVLVTLGAIASALTTASTLGANAKAEIQSALGVALKDIAL